jgi:hypothetical protein
MRRRLISYSIFATLVLSVGVYGFKKFKSSSVNECFCENLSEAVLPSIALKLENEQPWEKGSYHLVKWKKSCNVFKIELEIGNEGGEMLRTETFNYCDSEYLFKIPSNASEKLKITVNAVDQEGQKTAVDTRWISIAEGDQSTYQWQSVTKQAAFQTRDGAIPAVINNRMFLFGGWNPAEKEQTNNEIWSSEDGKEWKFLGNAPWERRHCSGRASFKNKFWIIGGDCNQGHYQNDIWATEDGVNWVKVLDSIPWIPRMNFGVQVFDNKIWLVGGERINVTVAEEKQAFNDVYYSEDGIHWKKSGAAIPGQRAHLGKFSGMNKLFLLGGSQYHNQNTTNDVWTSKDGKKWDMVLKTTPWKKLCFSNVIEFDDKLWVIGGSGPSGNSNEVWYTADGFNWYRMENIPWAPRHSTSLYNFNGSMMLVAGYLYNDVWQLKKSI